MTRINSWSAERIVRESMKTNFMEDQRGPWITGRHTQWEFLREKHPGRKHLFLLDNAGPHKSSKTYDNLDLHYFQPQCTGYLQLGSIYRF